MFYFVVNAELFVILLYITNSGSLLCWIDPVMLFVKTCVGDTLMIDNYDQCSNINCAEYTAACLPTCVSCRTKTAFCIQPGNDCNNAVIIRYSLFVKNFTSDELFLVV